MSRWFEKRLAAKGAKAPSKGRPLTPLILFTETTHVTCTHVTNNYVTSTSDSEAWDASESAEESKRSK